MAGHSAGNHIVARMLEDSCGLAKAFIMIDPVDGVDPFGKVTKLSIELRVLMLSLLLAD